MLNTRVADPDRRRARGGVKTCRPWFRAGAGISGPQKGQ
jgi:D-hexose-6-phosphate mutarotase